MRDYAEIVNNLRCCTVSVPCDNCTYQNDTEKCTFLEKDAADAIEELLAELVTIRNQLPKWISVEDVPPETGKPIFVVDNRGNVANAILTSNYVVGDEGGYGYIGRITYWCKSLQLPAPPTEGGN